MARIILASASKRRTELLKQLGLSHQVVPSDLNEETVTDDNVETVVAKRALAKAKRVAGRTSGVVIGADTVITIGDKVLGKPANRDAARAMLRLLSGNRHQVLTGVAVCRGERSKTDVEQTDVYFRELTDAQIDAYIDTGEPFGKAGGYAIQGKGALLVRRIDGCYFNVVGLPLVTLAELLGSFGVSVL